MRLPRLLNAPLRFQTAAAWALVGSLGALSGCDVQSFIDPAETGGLRHVRGRTEPLVVNVLDELDPAMEEGGREFANAEPPRPEDLVTEPTDYVITPNDVVAVTISDLQGPGLDTVKQAAVSGTGNITLPYLPNVVRAEGLTEAELQQAVVEAYRQAGVLENAQVSASVIEARGRSYSIIGSVARPATYFITNEDFRLLDALTQAGDLSSPLLEDLYIIRKAEQPRRRPAPSDGGSTTTAPATAPANGAEEPADDLAPPQSNSGRLPREMKRAVAYLLADGTADELDPAAPAEPAGAAASEVAPEEGVTPEEVMPEEATPEEATPEEAMPEEAMPDVDPGEVPSDEVMPDADPGEVTPGDVTPEEIAPEEVTPSEVMPSDVSPGAEPDEVVPAEDDPAARVGRIDGEGIVVEPGDEATPAPAGTADMTPPVSPTAPFEFDDMPESEAVRVIRIPVNRLRGGDLQYNVAIRPRDTIIVPPGSVGFYYMEGHVASPGAYQLTGPKVTLREAIWAARGLDALAIPQRTDIVRRINANEKMYVRVDLARVFSGQAPDIYLKPGDEVNVGTNFVAPFIAAVRGGFRFTYGLGFLYDRNFAPDRNDNRN